MSTADVCRRHGISSATFMVGRQGAPGKAFSDALFLGDSLVNDPIRGRVQPQRPIGFATPTGSADRPLLRRRSCANLNPSLAPRV